MLLRRLADKNKVLFVFLLPRAKRISRPVLAIYGTAGLSKAAANPDDVKESDRQLKSAESVQLIEIGNGIVSIKVESGSYKFSSILPAD